MRTLCLSLFLSLTAFGVVLARPLISPQPDARRLGVPFFGAPAANGPGHDPVTGYRAIERDPAADLGR